MLVVEAVVYHKVEPLVLVDLVAAEVLEHLPPVLLERMVLPIQVAGVAVVVLISPAPLLQAEQVVQAS